MLFRRRTPLNFLERLKVAVWPSNSWSRSFKYFTKRVLRLSGSPHAIATGVAIGVFISWTPFLGAHIIMSVVISVVIGANAIAAAFGTAIGNPLTFPFMWWSTYKLGVQLLGIKTPHIRFSEIAHGITHEPVGHILPIFKPMLVGSIPLGLVSGVVAYAIVWFAVRAYQIARRQRLATRRRNREAVPLPPAQVKEANPS
jgi:uncharacterized protein (DUF2062 family)